MRGISVSFCGLFILLLALMMSCQNDEEIIPSNPDAVVDYDPVVEGVFEGDESREFPDDIEPEGNLPTSFKDSDTNSLSNATIDQAPDFSMEEFVVAFDKVSSNFQGLNPSSNEFAEKIIEEIKSSSSSSSRTARINNSKDVQSIFDKFNNLTPEEKALVLKNPVKAYRSNAAANAAVQATVSLFGENGYKTRSDAFRHSYWNWLMSKCCSVDWARAFATAHESQTPNNDDKRMDLNNNMIGRRLFAGNPSASETEAQAALLDYKLLWVNEEQINVTVGIDYLVYLSPVQSLTVFDDGPEYDDIYEILWDGRVLGTTPQGGSRAFEFSQIASGTYDLDIHCTLDGTKGGCGFQIILDGAMRLGSGERRTPQIIIGESAVHNNQATFPTMKVRKIDLAN